jgi:opacity protein-like surface antigen
MRFVVAGLGLAVLLAALATAADAKKPVKKHKQYAAHQAAQPARSREQWYARDASKLPFGSSIWWDQMLRENRLTCCN